MINKHAIIKGRVQGVCYRLFTKRVAEELEIYGWVRNISDGTVELICQGRTDKMALFFNRLKEGPKHSSVESIEFFELEDEDKKYVSFEIVG